MKELKEMGKSIKELDGYRLYKDESGCLAIYTAFEDEGKEYALFRGYLAHPENFEVVVADLKYETQLMLKEMFN